VAMLQLDMIGAGEDTLYLDRRGELTPKLNTAARALGLSTEIINLGGSDHVPFMEAHVPAGLLIWFGPEETEATAHYHRPVDTAAIIEPDKLAAAGRLANLATLALAEGEPAILELLKTRFKAVNRGDLDAFLKTGTPARRPIDRAWFTTLQKLRSPELELEATRLRVAGDVATATVKVALEHAPNWPLKSSETVWLPVRFTYQEDGWRWDGPALIWQAPPDGFPVAHPPGYRAEALELSRLAVRQYARIAGQLGLPVGSRGRLMIYPDQQALRGDSNLILPPDVEALVDPGGDYPPLVKLVHTPHLSRTRQVTDTLVQLALAEAGLTESTLPWLWQGLPLVYRGHATPATARTNHLPGLYDALVSNAGGGHASPLTSDSLAWAAVEFLREQVGWAGLGQLAIALGRGASPDRALTQVVGLDEAEFDSRWRAAWQARLQQAQAGLAALLAARQQAVLGNDSAAFLQSVDPADPILLVEESYWFSQLALHPVEQFELSGQPLALLENGDLLAEITMKYQLAGDKNRRSVPLAVRLRATDSGYRWAGALFETRSSERFVIHYPAGYEKVVQDLMDQAGPIYRQVTADLQIEPNEPIPIKLFTQPDPFRASIALAAPDWLEGWAAAGQSVKLLATAQSTQSELGRSLARQLSRALLVRSESQFSWLPEGLALVEAGRLSRTDERAVYDHYLPLLAKSIRIGQWFPLAEPLDVYGLPEKEAELAYAQSWDQVSYLIDRYGQAKLSRLLVQLGRGQTIEAAFQQVYDLPPAEFESVWREAAEKGHVRPEWVDLAQSFDVAAAEVHIDELTRPELAGRQAGTAGETAAAAYIADKFAAYGLTPAGDDHTFFQRFPITTPVLPASPRLWPLAENGEPRAALRYRQEFGLIQAEGAGGGQVEAEVVWLRGEDYGSIRLAGKIVLREMAGPVEAEIEQAIAHGAGGLILVSTRLDKELRAKEFPVDDLEAIVEASAGGIPVVELTQDGFKRLLATAGYTPADLKNGPPVMPLDLRLLLEAPLEWQALESANVVGLLPGSDPVLKNEILILAAAYDHVGDDPDDRVCLETGECLELPGYKYPGANDDASAVAVLLELARLWHQNGYRPARTVLFAAWGGQELADAGSRHYLAHPSAPLTDVVGILQLEAVGGGRGFRLQAQGDWQREAVLRFATETAANQMEARLAWTEVDQPASRESFRNLGIPGLLLRWEKAEPHNLPAEFDDEVEPLRLGQTGRTVTLASMMLAR
jgi:Zn-dependent M28 family amino/carboxypeptidase